MKRLLLLGLLAMACGGESQALFEDDGVSGSRNAGGVTSRPSAGSSSGGSESQGSAGGEVSEAGAASGGGSGALAGAGGGAEPVGGSASGSNAAGSGGQPEAGTAGASSSAGKGGQNVGGSGGTGGVSGGGGGSAGGGGEPTEPEVPAACMACMGNTKAFCDVSAVHPAGACIACPEFGPDANLYRDCDGPGAEHYVSKNDHDPGYGCETYVGYMGSCP